MQIKMDMMRILGGMGFLVPLRFLPEQGHNDGQKHFENVINCFMSLMHGFIQWTGPHFNRNFFHFESRTMKHDEEIGIRVIRRKIFAGAEANHIAAQCLEAGSGIGDFLPAKK